MAESDKKIITVIDPVKPVIIHDDPENINAEGDPEHNHTAAALDASLGGTDSARLMIGGMSKMKVAGSAGGLAAGGGNVLLNEIAKGVEEAGGEVTRAGGAFTAGVTAISLVNGLTELKKAYGEDKKPEGAPGAADPGTNRKLDLGLGLANTGVGLSNLAISGMEIAGKAAPELLEGVTRGAGEFMLAATAVVNISNAKPEDRLVVTGGEALKAVGGIGAAAMGEGAAAALGLTGGLAAAAPIVMGAAAVYAIDKGYEKFKGQRDDYQNFERELDEIRKPGRDIAATPGKSPDPGDYKNLMIAMRLSSDNIRYDRIESPSRVKGPITVDLDATLHPDDARAASLATMSRDLAKSEMPMEKFGKSAAFMLKVDMKNPANLKEMRHAIDTEIAKQEQIMKANDSSVAAYARTSDGILRDFSPSRGRSAEEYIEAKKKLAHLESGRDGLTNYQKDLKAYQEKKAAQKAGPPSPQGSHQVAVTAPPAYDVVADGNLKAGVVASDKFNKVAPRTSAPPQAVAEKTVKLAPSPKAADLAAKY